MTNLIVVGIDGSDGAVPALDWAADEARLRNAPMLLLHASRALIRDGALTEDGYDRLEAVRANMLDAARTHVLRRAPGLDVHVQTAAAEPGSALVAVSERARLVVVGARGTSGFDGLLLGSVSLHTAAHARCPVAVMPHAVLPDPGGPVVLGVDERHQESEAIGWAFAEADRRGSGLVAVHGVHGFGAPGQRIGEEMELAEALAGWTSKYPDVPCEQRIVPVKAGSALVEASRGAAVTVVGAGRRDGRPGMALGRVNHAVLHHAGSPVVVVPEH